MNNKFKIGQFVIVTGKGKCDGKLYINKKGKVIEKDYFFCDYLIEFSNGTRDWLDTDNLRPVRKYNKKEK